MAQYAIGVDFGTESGRAVLIDVSNGRERATSVYRYANGVIDQHLPDPDADVRLEPDWALQDPADYIRTFQQTVPRLLAETGIDPGRRRWHRHRLHRLHDAAHYLPTARRCA